MLASAPSAPLGLTAPRWERLAALTSAPQAHSVQLKELPLSPTVKPALRGVFALQEPPRPTLVQQVFTGSALVSLPPPALPLAVHHPVLVAPLDLPPLQTPLSAGWAITAQGGRPPLPYPAPLPPAAPHRASVQSLLVCGA